MRKVFLEKLPRKSGYGGKRVDWERCKNHMIRFVYDNIEDYIELLDWNYYKNTKNKDLKIRYKSKIYYIGTSEFMNCNLGDFLKLVNLTDVEYNRIINLRLNKKENGSLTEFKLSDDNTYWIGLTQQNEEFWFDGDEKTIEYIKSFSWRKTTYNYFQNRKGEKLHRIVMNIYDKDVFVNHLGGNKWDNRREKLSISNCKDNCKEKLTNGKSGIVGLTKRGKSNKWVAMVNINGTPVNSKYKEKDEALIDLLIIQKQYGFRHNENLYYLLENIQDDRIKEVLDNIEIQLNKKRTDRINSTNYYELSEDKTFYWVYSTNKDKEINKFKISLESKEIVKQGIWHIAEDKHHDKLYVHGTIVVDGIRKTIRLHRYLRDILDIKYKHWYIDHLNGNSLDNRLANLVITDAQGNGLNKLVKGYTKRGDKWRVMITMYGKQFRQTVDTEQKAINLVIQKKKEAMQKRLQFYNKHELDTYLKQHLVQAS